MPNWKKVIVSGSNAVLNNITSSGNISSSGTVYAENVFLPHAGGINFADTNTFIRGGTEDINIDGDNSVQLIGDNSVVFNTPHTVATGFIQATSHITSSEVRVAGHITASGNISASGTITANSFVGDGSGLTGIAASSFDFDGLSNTSVSNTSVVDADLFAFSDAGTEKKITYAQLYGNIFGELDGDISVTAGGAVTIAANSVALSTDTTGDYVATVTDAGAGAGIVIGGTSGEGAEASIKVDLNDLAAAAVDVAADSIAIIDANASNGSKKESIADLATAMASTGITATSGVFTTNDSEIDHDSLNNFSADEHFTQANITTVGTVTSGNVTAILPSGTVTGSAQVAMGGDISGNANNATVAKVQGVALTSGEATQLAAIDSVTITNTQWGYVGALNQSLTATSDVNFNDLTVAGDLTVQGDVIELQTTNLNIEDQFILLHSGSAANTSDSGIIFGGSGGTAQQGKALIWDSNYAASGEGRLAVRTTDLAANSTSDFAAGTTGYYVAGVFEGNSTDAATAKADHNGNIRIESNEIYIYA